MLSLTLPPGAAIQSQRVVPSSALFPELPYARARPNPIRGLRFFEFELGRLLSSDISFFGVGIGPGDSSSTRGAVSCCRELRRGRGLSLRALMSPTYRWKHRG